MPQDELRCPDARGAGVWAPLLRLLWRAGRGLLLDHRDRGGRGGGGREAGPTQRMDESGEDQGRWITQRLDFITRKFPYS